MASAPTQDTRNGSAPLVPPEEQFWKRYSPHGEAPMSMAGSVALHLLVVGVMALFALYLASLFYKPQRTLPIEPVRLQIGGGGGSKTGKSIDGKGAPHEDVGGDPGEVPLPGAEEDTPRPSLTPVETAKVAEKFDDDSARRIQKSETGKAMARLSDSLRAKLNKGLASAKGEGGSGTGGGKGTGTGTGEGSASGPGKATLSKREKRMLRWHMRFTANTGAEYLSQLNGLGAILAIPVKEGEEPQYKIVRDLRRGGKLLDEDVSGIQRIYWIDDKPQSVRDILAALGQDLRPTPSRFVAFMPEKLETQLYDMERKYVEKTLKRKFDEDLIDETNFRVVRAAGGWRPELINVSMRR